MINMPDHAIGPMTQVRLPAHGRALMGDGAAFLTEAFRVFGVLAPDNQVTRIDRMDKCSGGSTGEKLFLSVAYERDNETLHRNLFAKFSRDFSDPVRDQRGKYELEGEVKFAEISRRAAFPVRVPKTYFADYDSTTHTGLLITERIDFGRGALEPQYGKCMDQLLPDPVLYYRVIVRAMARVAAAHRSGRLGSDIDHLLPYDADKAALALRVIPDERSLREQIAMNASFIADNAQLYPADLDYDRLFAALDMATTRYCSNPDRLGYFLTQNRTQVALCHWNANIDNCWFWRDGRGALDCGLLDWGHAGQFNLAFALWGCLSGAARTVWNEHLDELLALFVTELENGGGPALDPEELARDLLLYAFIMYLDYFVQTPTRIQQKFLGLDASSGPLDPLILGHETVRNQLVMSTNLLNLLKLRELNNALDQAFHI